MASSSLVFWEIAFLCSLPFFTDFLFFISHVPLVSFPDSVFANIKCHTNASRFLWDVKDGEREEESGQQIWWLLWGQNSRCFPFFHLSWAASFRLSFTSLLLPGFFSHPAYFCRSITGQQWWLPAAGGSRPGWQQQQLLFLHPSASWCPVALP